MYLRGQTLPCDKLLAKYERNYHPSVNKVNVQLANHLVCDSQIHISDEIGGYQYIISTNEPKVEHTLPQHPLPYHLILTYTYYLYTTYT